MRHRSAPPGRRSPIGNSRRAAAAATAPAAVHFQLGRITVEGFTLSAQKRFEHSLRSHLTGLALAHSSDRWMAAAGINVGRLDAGQLPPGASPEETARHIAEQIFDRLTEQTGGKPHA
ncbi:MAG TPA: hypothetical protein VGR96_13275 [Acidobacteriaceae bacterium]|nr:hypothetical protein [Acidobacteriaceae bacterium]